MSLPWSEPKASPTHTHLCGNPGFRNAFLMRLVGVGDCAQPPIPHRLPRCEAKTHSAAPRCATGPLAPFDPQPTAFRFAWERQRACGAGSAPVRRFTRRASNSCHAACDQPPTFGLLDVAQAPGFSGEPSRRPVEWVPPRSNRSPALNRRAAWVVERRVSGARRCRGSCAADRMDAHRGARRLRR